MIIFYSNLFFILAWNLSNRMKKKPKSLKRRSNRICNHYYITQIGNKCIFMVCGKFRLLQFKISSLRNEIKFAYITLLWNFEIFRIMFLMMVTFILSICIFSFIESQSYKIISAFETIEINKAPKDIDSIFINVGSKV